MKLNTPSVKTADVRGHDNEFKPKHSEQENKKNKETLYIFPIIKCTILTNDLGIMSKYYDYCTTRKG